MGGIEGNFILPLYLIILSMAVLEQCCIVVAKFVLCERLQFVNAKASCFLWLLSVRQSVFMSQQIKSSAWVLYRCF